MAGKIILSKAQEEIVAGMKEGLYFIDVDLYEDVDLLKKLLGVDISESDQCFYLVFDQEEACFKYVDGPSLAYGSPISSEDFILDELEVSRA